jgi:hypothetical protein
MADLERFKFTVPGYSPETMPLDRLMEYLNQLSIVLGSPGDLHLVAVEKGSTRPVLAMRHDVAQKARHHAREVAQGGGSQRRREAFETIRRMVAKDGGKPAILRAPEGQILKFPSVDIGQDQVIQYLRQPTSINGTLVRIGGIGENAQLLIQEMNGNVIAGCTATRPVAQDMARLIYHAIRVSGIGTWHRNEEGKWAISRLHVQSFEPLDESELEDVVAKLQAVKVRWPADSIEQLKAMREQAA